MNTRRCLSTNGSAFVTGRSTLMNDLRHIWRKRKRLPALLVIDLVLFFIGIVLVFPLGEFYVPWEAQVVEVQKGRTNVRAGPSKEYDILFKLPITPKLGTATIIGETNDWYELETQDGVPCKEECKYTTDDELKKHCESPEETSTCRLRGMSRRDTLEPRPTEILERLARIFSFTVQNLHYLLYAIILWYLPLLRSYLRSLIWNSATQNLSTPTDAGAVFD